MEIKHLKRNDHRRMPWKNGHGYTLEVAVYPENASVDSFDWRISMATVPYNGWFSLFEKIDRTLILMEGSGVELHIAKQQHDVTPGNPLISFPGDVDCYAALIDGGVEDLNIMTRRGVFNQDVKLVNFDTSDIAPLIKNNAFAVCLSEAGSLTFEGVVYQLNRQDVLAISNLKDQKVNILGQGKFAIIILRPEKS